MRWFVILFSALVIAAVVGTILLGSNRPEPASASLPAGSAAVAESPGDRTGAESPPEHDVARTDDDPVRTSDDSDDAGAVQAAVDAVQSIDRVVRAGFISRRDLIASFATPEFGPRLSDLTTSQTSDLLLQLGAGGDDPSRLALREVAVAAEMLSSTGDVGEVRVWSVLVVALDTAAPARAIWRTSVLDMERVDGVWLVDGWRSELGPAPALAPEQAVSNGSEIAALLASNDPDGDG